MTVQATSWPLPVGTSNGCLPAASRIASTPGWAVTVKTICAKASASLCAPSRSSVSGTSTVATVFSRPGLGYTAITAINQQDLPVIIGIVLFASAAVVVANILVDMGYAVLDPRVRLH